MESKGFSVGEMLKKGWRLMRRHIGFFVGFLLIWFILHVAPQAIAALYPDLNAWLMALISVVFCLLIVLVWIGFLKSALKAADGENPTFVDLFSSAPILVQFIIGWILYSLIIVVGLFLLVFPAAIWGSRYFMWPFVMIDKKIGPIKSLMLSGKMTMGVKWDVFMLIIASWLITMIGVALIFVGSFVAIPIVTIAHAATYRMLESQHRTV